MARRDRDLGFVAPGFEEVETCFATLLAADDGYSAQVVALWKGETIVDLAGGNDLDGDSITGVFSVTKGVAAVALALLVDDGRLDLSSPVTRYWPEFAAHGKHDLLVGEVLSHQAGLVNAPKPLTADEYLDSSAGAARLAASAPLWRPRSSFGYHGLTIGILIEELVRRVADTTIQELYEREVRAPRGIDFYLGLPESQESRFRPVLPVVPTTAQQAELDAHPRQSDDLMALAFGDSFADESALSRVLPRSRSGRAAGFVSLGGVGSARGIASVYAAALGDLGESLVSRATVAQMSQEQVAGVDRILNSQMAFATVFMKPQPRVPFGSYQAFGHDGAGGALGFADPLYDLAFGYIPMPMQYPGGADTQSIELSTVIRGCIRSLS